MSEEITRETPYLKLKKWFLDNFDDLPDTLDGKNKFYNDVKFLAGLKINDIDLAFEKMGKVNIKKSRIAINGKRVLFELYTDLQNKENWNITHDEYTNKYWNEREKKEV